MKKRICSIFLLLTLLLALLPLQANAVTAGMAALDMQEISRTEYQISKDVKEYEWLLNNGSLTKQMDGSRHGGQGRKGFYRERSRRATATTTSVTSKTTNGRWSRPPSRRRQWRPGAR